MQTSLSRIPRFKLTPVQTHLLGFVVLLLSILAVATAPFTIGPAIQWLGRVAGIFGAHLAAGWTAFWACLDSLQKTIEPWMATHAISTRTATCVFAVGAFWWLGAAGSAERMQEDAKVAVLRAGSKPAETMGNRKLVRCYYVATIAFLVCWVFLLWMLPSEGFTLLVNAFAAAGGIPPLLVELVAWALMLLSWLPVVLLGILLLGGLAYVCQQ